MGEENRSSSGSSTMMIVLAILGGVLVVGCCGGIVAVGLLGTLAWESSASPQMQMQPPIAAPVYNDPLPEVSRSLDDMNKDAEMLKTEPESVTSPESAVPAVEPPPADPALDEKKE